jgi:hypothetical protein
MHNRYLPEWLHRIVNACVVGFIWGTATGYLSLSASPGSVLETITRWTFLLTPLIVFVMLFVPYSIVRGVAGGDGYDELR